MAGLIAQLDHCVIHMSLWTLANPFYRDMLVRDPDGSLMEFISYGS